MHSLHKTSAITEYTEKIKVQIFAIDTILSPCPTMQCSNRGKGEIMILSVLVEGANFFLLPLLVHSEAWTTEVPDLRRKGLDLLLL